MGMLVSRPTITAREALILATRNSLHLTFEESQKGSIEPGKLADLVVLDSNPLRREPSRLLGVQIIASLVGGGWSTGISEDPCVGRNRS